MKRAAPIALALLSACGELPPTDASLETGQTLAALRDAPAAETAAPSVAAWEAAMEDSEGDAAAYAAHPLTGIDCGTVIPQTAGEYVLSEVSQLEALDRSGCTYFVGNVRVAFTVPLVPSAQRYLFSASKVTDITGQIVQRSRSGANSTQGMSFSGLQHVGSIEVHPGQTCHYQALTQAGTIVLHKSSSGCMFPALTHVTTLKMDEATTIRGFNALTSVSLIDIEGDAPSISGFKALANGGSIRLVTTGSKAGAWTGSFPALTTVTELEAERVSFKEFKLPKFTNTTGNLTLRRCDQSLAPLKAMTTIGRNLTIEEFPTSYAWHEGPATLTEIGGSLNLNLGHTIVRGYDGLRSVGGPISIQGTMNDLAGFGALTEAGSVVISGGQETISGFAKLATVHGTLRIKTLGVHPYAQKIDAFPVLSEVKGAFELLIASDASTAFPKLRTVAGSFRYELDRGTRLYATSFARFPALESVGGALSTRAIADGFNTLLRVGGTLSILDVPSAGLGYYTIPGFRKVTTVGGDLVLDKRVTQYGRDGTQRLLDQLVGFTGKILLQ